MLSESRLLEIHNLKSLEQFLLSLEIGFQGSGEQRLPEAARAAQEDIGCIVGKLPHQVGLVNVDKSFAYDTRERLNAYRIFSCHSSSVFLMVQSYDFFLKQPNIHASFCHAFPEE